ncbi:methyltransferase domain-containing protein [Micromonospora sp. AKA38]|uniref:methyltransferase domain-containing protein n=1 Tax=Micromonospora sp. AKA38 TaxID=2733861 RepID=UPI0022BF5C49|nr:methyltransferase domain-containing protein [Micromonospora sp. AKA38]GHJ16883.1 methyltransferase type 12 [Micromonospora sp. AKA38]
MSAGPASATSEPGLRARQSPTRTSPAGATGVPAGVDAFDIALRERTGSHWLVQADGVRRRLPVERWHGPAEAATATVVARCHGPALDLGCGPGRLTAALTRAGLAALGVDVCPRAVASTRARGAVAVRADLFDPLPAEGRWRHVVLLDGNIGIGGDPARLLRRCRELLHPDGTVLVELDPPGSGAWQGRAHVVSGRRRGPSFGWARLDTRAVHGPATATGLSVRDLRSAGGRWFAELAVA